MNGSDPERAPAVVVRSVGDVRLALGAGRPVTLLSPAGAGAWAGPLWWRALLDAAASHGSCGPLDGLLDCGDAPGRALEALRLGERALVLTATDAVVVAVRARAEPLGAVVLGRRPSALDLAPFRRDESEGRRRLACWLEVNMGANRVAGSPLRSHADP